MRYAAGVRLPDWHYMLPPEPRLPEARRLIEQGHYFVVHAPRQTGKTTTLTSLARTLIAEGRYAVVYASCERGRAVGTTTPLPSAASWPASIPGLSSTCRRSCSRHRGRRRPMSRCCRRP